MTTAPGLNAQHQASTTFPHKREWKKPVLDILDLADAQGGHFTNPDGVHKHKSG
jgi:hypothetical protein